MRTRREARERAVVLLYEADIRDLDAAEVAEPLPISLQDYTLDLINGVDTHRPDIDSLIEHYAKGWRLDRMPTMDRAILRLAVFELLHRPDVPMAAVLSEAVELAKEYSTSDSGRFVNGVLASVAVDHRPAEGEEC